MAGIISATPADIQQAVETQLVAKAIVPTSDAIYWWRVGDDPAGKPTGIRDLLIVWSQEQVDILKQIGGGAIGMRMRLSMEVHLRSMLESDRVNTRKDWLVDHATRRKALIAAMENFDPRDSYGNSMTIYNLRLDAAAVPVPDRRGLVGWGETVGTWRCVYCPSMAGVPIG